MKWYVSRYIVVRKSFKRNVNYILFLHLRFLITLYNRVYIYIKYSSHHIASMHLLTYSLRVKYACDHVYYYIKYYRERNYQFIGFWLILGYWNDIIELLNIEILVVSTLFHEVINQ